MQKLRNYITANSNPFRVEEKGSETHIYKDQILVGIVYAPNTRSHKYRAVQVVDGVEKPKGTFVDKEHAIEFIIKISRDDYRPRHRDDSKPVKRPKNVKLNTIQEGEADKKELLDLVKTSNNVFFNVKIGDEIIKVDVGRSSATWILGGVFENINRKLSYKYDGVDLHIE